jgi:hypothetical protein
LEHTASGVRAATLATDTRRVPSAGSDLVDVAVLDRIFADGRTSLTAAFLDGSLLRVLCRVDADSGW